MTIIDATADYDVYTIDGDCTVSGADILAGNVGTEWSDEQPLAIWDVDGMRVGTIDPYTGDVFGVRRARED